MNLDWQLSCSSVVFIQTPACPVTESPTMPLDGPSARKPNAIVPKLKPFPTPPAKPQPFLVPMEWFEQPRALPSFAEDHKPLLRYSVIEPKVLEALHDFDVSSACFVVRRIAEGAHGKGLEVVEIDNPCTCYEEGNRKLKCLVLQELGDVLQLMLLRALGTASPPRMLELARSATMARFDDTEVGTVKQLEQRKRDTSAKLYKMINDARVLSEFRTMYNGAQLQRELFMFKQFAQFYRTSVSLPSEYNDDHVQRVLQDAVVAIKLRLEARFSATGSWDAAEPAVNFTDMHRRCERESHEPPLQVGSIWLRDEIKRLFVIYSLGTCA